MLTGFCWSVGAWWLFALFHHNTKCMQQWNQFFNPLFFLCFLFFCWNNSTELSFHTSWWHQWPFCIGRKNVLKVPSANLKLFLGEVKVEYSISLCNENLTLKVAPEKRWLPHGRTSPVAIVACSESIRLKQHVLCCSWGSSTKYNNITIWILPYQQKDRMCSVGLVTLWHGQRPTGQPDTHLLICWPV